MATLTTVRLNKGDSPNWGFRLQGGKDFGTPLVIQKVNGGSPAERAGLIAGDSVIKINNVDVYNLLHKEAQDVIVRSGPSFDMVIQRGGSTWKPSVIPTGHLPKPSPVINNYSPVTKTSLAANKGENIGAIGTGHNLSAKPFSPQVNGAVNGGSNKLINKQYNTPIKLYSEDAIAETLSAQTEVLSTGALGVNFKKNEKNYDATNSAVYRMLQEAEKEPEHFSNPSDEPDSGIVTAPNKGIAGLRHVEAPVDKPQPPKPQLPPGQNICAECERLIVGVFVRIKDKNLHVECFKCATCGTSLKNAGYYNINNKLYCDIHAKSAAIAINNPSAIPITLSPGSKAPTSTISAALSSHSLPSAGPLSPKAPTYTPSYPSSGPKPFSSVSAPLSPGGTLPRAGPLSPGSNLRGPVSPSAPSYTSYSPASATERCTNIIWPPPQEETEVPTASPLFYPPPSKIEAHLKEKRAKKQTRFETEYFTEENIETEDPNMDETTSFYSEELNFSGRRSAMECVEILSETLDTQKLVEHVIKSTPSKIPPPLQPKTHLDSGAAFETKAQDKIVPETNGKSFQDSEELKRPTQYTPNTIECQLPSKIENAVPQKWEPALTQAVRTVPPDPDTFSRIPARRSASPLTSALTTAPTQPYNPLSTKPLEPVSLPEETEPYFPPEHPIIPVVTQEIEQPKKEERLPPPKPYSPFVKALEIAPDRPFTPVGGVPVVSLPPVKKKPKDVLDQLLEELPKPAEKLDMRTALMTASDRSYTPLLTEYSGTTTPEPKQKKTDIDRSKLVRPLKPEELPASFKMHKQEPKPPSYYGPAVIEERIQSHSLEEEKSESQFKETTQSTENKETTITEKEMIQPAQVSQEIITVPQEFQQAPSSFAPMFQGFTCSFKNKTDHSQFSVEVCTTPPVPNVLPQQPSPITYVATVQQQPGYITKERFVEEKTDLQHTTQRQEKIEHKVEVKGEQKQVIQKQAEEIIQVKPVPVTTMLRKPELLPSYQLDLKATAEADLLIMERKQRAQERLEQQKKEKEQQLQQHIIEQEEVTKKQQSLQQEEQKLEQQKQIQQIVQEHSQQQKLLQESVHSVPPKPERKHTTKPIITIEPDQTNGVASKLNFQPVTEKKPASTTFSPRPRSITPSMINKAPPLLPYYQDNLIAHFHAPIDTNLFDPTSPTISRSPSPYPDGRSRSPSPFPGNREERAKSPAQGPPPNPLKTLNPLPTPEDSRKHMAAENLKSYITGYKSQSDKGKQVNVYQVSGKENNFQNGFSQNSQNISYPVEMYENHFSMQKANAQQEVSSYGQQQLTIANGQKHESKITQSGSTISKTELNEKTHAEHLAAKAKVQSKSTEVSADGLTQVQRNKTVTEEYEHCHKETNIQIEKKLTTSKTYPFTKVNAPVVDPPIVQSFHVTNPHHLPQRNANISFEENLKIDTGRTLQEASQKLLETCQEDLAITSSNDKVEKPQITQKQYQSVPPQIPESQPIPPPPPPIRQVFAPGALAPIKHVIPPSASQKSSQIVTKPSVPQPDIGHGTGRQTGGISIAPKRGRGILNPAAIGGARIPLCGHCHGQIRGPFITALGKIWCPQHFVCATPSCRRPLQDIGFVEENGQLHCEYCFERYLAPPCSKCSAKIKGDCLKAIGKNFHPECFNCVYCGKLFGNSPFFLEDGNPYCENDWNQLFTTKCYACAFPIEAGDRWVEALNNNYHSQCFNCSMCKKNLEGQSFFAKGGRPFCKNHAR